MTREEAIRRIKAWNLDSDDREVLAVIIPELRESEDERIRKAIRVILIATEDEQKENSKTADFIPSNCVSDAKCEDIWHKVEDSLPDNGREVLAKDKLGNTLLARYDGEGWDVSVYDDEDYRCHNGISKWCEIPPPSSLLETQRGADGGCHG